MPNEDEVFMYLVYSPSNISDLRWWGSNDQTCYAKTGFDYYEVVEVGNLEYNTTFLWTRTQTHVNPYFIVYAEKRGADNVTVIYDGMKYTAPKSLMTYEGQHGKDWLEFFHYEPVVK